MSRLTHYLMLSVLAFSPLACHLLRPVCCHGAERYWDSDSWNNQLHDRSSFGYGFNWANLTLPTESDVAVFDSHFTDARGDVVVSIFHVLFGATTPVFNDGTTGDPIPAINAINSSARIAEGDLWVFDFGSHADAALNGSYTLTNTLNIGQEGASLKLQGKGGLSSKFIDLGDLGTGVLTIDGSQGTWLHATTFRLGQNGGRGEAMVQSGASVIATELMIGASTGSTGIFRAQSGSTGSYERVWVGFDGYGEFHITGGSQTADRMWVGRYAGSEGVLLVSGGELIVDEGLVVGDSGKGTLDVSGGALVSAQYARIGGDIGSLAEVRVSGPGSHLETRTGSVAVGDLGDGTLRVSNGGLVTSAGAEVGWRESAQGHVVISDATWNNSGGLRVGIQGTGTVEIEDGATVTDAWANVGASSTNLGSIRVSGQFTKWLNDGQVGVGDTGDGEAVVTYGATVTSDDVKIGWRNGAHGNLTVQHDGSTWQSSDTIDVGYQGSGELNVKQGGKVSSIHANIGNSVGSQGVANIDGAGSSWNVSRSMHVGRDGTGSLSVSNGGAVSVFASGTDSQLFVGSNGTIDLSEGGSIVVGEGALPDPGSIFVGPSGTLGGTGMVHASVIVGGGTLSPGQSPGTLFLDSVLFQPDAFLLMELGGTNPGDYDVLSVSGDAHLGGTLILDFENWYAPATGDTFDLIEYGAGLTGEFDQIVLRDIEPDWQYSLETGGGVVRLISNSAASAVPEPSSTALWAVAIGACLLIPRLQRRKRCADRG